MVLRSLHPPISTPLLQEMRRQLGDLTESLNRLQADATALISASYEEARCREHEEQRCALCVRSGVPSARARADAAAAARPTLRLVMAAQLIDVFHAADPSMTVDELMSILGDAWYAMHGTGREVEG